MAAVLVKTEEKNTHFFIEPPKRLYEYLKVIDAFEHVRKNTPGCVTPIAHVRHSGLNWRAQIKTLPLCEFFRFFLQKVKKGFK